MAGGAALGPALGTEAAPHPLAIQLTAGEQDIVIDIVRHGDDLPPADSRIPFSPKFPGAPLSELGQQHAQDTANQLYAELGGPNHIAGLFEGSDLDAQDTAVPFATLEEMTPQVLSGLTEVDGGIYANLPIVSPGGIMYDLAVLAWPLGLVDFFPIPGALDFNGVVTDEKYETAVQTMYDAAMANPVVSDNGQITDVAFSSEASTMTWVLDNVKNPDWAVIVALMIDELKTSSGFPEPLPNAAVVQIEGNPEDGWTLLSWAGHQIPQDPGLLTELIAAFRDAIMPPQVAANTIFDALLTGDPTTIEDALQTGLEDVGAGIAQFPGAVLNGVVDAVQNLSADLAAGESLSDAVDSAILGLG